jgi:hypothetical protein
MNRTITGLSLVALAALAAPVGATQLSVATYEPDVIPVLISVNKEGKVTKVLPSQKLKPSVARLLRDTIDQVVTAPAQRDGKAISSQIVMRMKLETTQGADGQYAAQFIPLEVKSVPAGSWSWRVDGNSYALSDDYGTGRDSSPQNSPFPGTPATAAPATPPSPSKPTGT